MKISVIVRNRNEERYIGYCLQSIVDFLGEDLQIVLVDNFSTDESIRIVNKFDYLQIDKIEISTNEYTPGKALNLGVSHSTGDLILVISAHCEISEFNLPKAIEGLQKNIAVYGKQIPIWDGKKISRRYMWSNFGDESATNVFCEFENRYFFHNGFSLFKKDSLLEFPFNEELSGKEDREWANNMIKKNNTIKYDSSLIVKHHYTINGATWKGTG
jgi:rhamnosyltransferase